MQQHIITGAPVAFVKSANKLIAERDVSLTLRSVSLSDGKLAAIAQEGSGASNSPGSLIEVRASAVKDGSRFIADLQAENPLWSVEAVFAAKGEESKASILVVASLRQP